MSRNSASSAREGQREVENQEQPKNSGRGDKKTGKKDRGREITQAGTSKGVRENTHETGEDRQKKRV